MSVPTTAPGDFIALGKQSKPNEGEVKRPSSPQLLGRKKDASGPSLSSTSLAKKPKLTGQAFGSLVRSHGDPSSLLGITSSSGIQHYDEIAITGERSH